VATVVGFLLKGVSPFPCIASPKPDDDSAGPAESVHKGQGPRVEPEGRALPRRVTTVHLITEDYGGKRLAYPLKVSVDRVKEEIYVTDSGNSRILVYTQDFYPLLAIGKSDGIEAPSGLSVDDDGSLYVAQAPDKKNPLPRITVLSPTLRWEKDILFVGFEGAEGFQPRNIAIHNQTGKIYVAGGYPGAVVLNKDGSFSHLLSPMDALKNQKEAKASICDVEIGAAGKIFLLSEDLGRVYVYDHKENFLVKFGEKGGSSGKLSRPRGLGVDRKKGIVYVIDYMRHAGNVYSDKGRFLFEFGGKGWAKGWFQFPSDIVVDTLGNVLVADTFNNRVQVLRME
jgi:DNA-binding beta-propeller fold protein YncE